MHCGSLYENIILYRRIIFIISLSNKRKYLIPYNEILKGRCRISNLVGDCACAFYAKICIQHSSTMFDWIFTQLMSLKVDYQQVIIPSRRNPSLFQVIWANTWASFRYKDLLSRYGYFHYEDKTVSRQSNLYDGNPYTGKTTSLYWDAPLAPWPPGHCRSCYWLFDICNWEYWTTQGQSVGLI